MCAEGLALDAVVKLKVIAACVPYALGNHKML
jgi:hypothetical protein